MIVLKMKGINTPGKPWTQNRQRRFSSAPRGGVFHLAFSALARLRINGIVG
ncbi:MAG: hypothetical protein KAQ69_03670 [Spirochaetales bacterium]|nr:hypothetical protein [Spirochaetales bacterium]